MSRFIYKYQEVEGFMMTKSYVENRHLLDEYEVEEDDVWVAGSPKAGTTWTEEMVWLIVNDLDFDGAKINLRERVPYFEHSVLMDIKSIATERNIEVPLYRWDTLKYIKEKKVKGKPMCFKTHLPFKFLPKQIQDGTKKPKIVFVARNLKDCCVSLHHFAKYLFGNEQSLEEIAKDYLEGKVLYSPAWEHTITYWNERHRSNLLIITYEEMIKDLPKILRKVADFIGKSYTDDQFQKLAEHLAFEKMKKNPAISFKNFQEINAKLGSKNGSGEFFRAGKVGSHKEELSQKIIEKFDRILAEKSKSSGFPFI